MRLYPHKLVNYFLTIHHGRKEAANRKAVLRIEGLNGQSKKMPMEPDSSATSRRRLRRRQESCRPCAAGLQRGSSL
jgi:hypothetical protein